MQTKEYIVALNEGVDFDQFWADMENPTSGLPHIPDRAVGITNNRTPFKRICEYALTDDEADRVRNDPRVAGIEIPVKNNPYVTIKNNISQTGNFNKTSLGSGPEINWGLIRHTYQTNVYGAGLITDKTYLSTLDGTGVDVVINDGGLQSDHPEFAGRVEVVNWTSFCPTYSSSSYIDTDGHGTHVAGIAAGKTFGWAKGSKIFSLHYNDNNASGDVLDCFEALINWHNSKGGSRPTVVNMSWGLTLDVVDIYAYITGGVYRGTPWVASPPGGPAGIGIVYEENPVQLPYYSDVYNTALSEVIDAGITVVQAAGNESSKVDVSGGLDYNNRLTLAVYPYTAYYHRGFSPSDPRVIMVGNLDSETKNGLDKRSVNYRSNTGPRIDVWAAGTHIVSACSNIYSLSPFVAYPYRHGDASFKQINISGTSMASPQVAGICALYLQKNPNSTPAQVRSWIKNNAITGQLYTTGLNNDYSNPESLLGATAGIAYLAPTGLARVKTDPNTWADVEEIKIKTSLTTWSTVRAIWTKTTSGWRQTF